MDAGKCVDAYGCMEGNDIEQADAEQAYIQAELSGTETWVEIPEDAWPDDWWIYPAGVKPGTADAVARRAPKYERPVCKLLRALYGHPDSGTMWEVHCNKQVAKCGFEPIPSWPSCFYNGELQLCLSI